MPVPRWRSTSRKSHRRAYRQDATSPAVKQTNPFGSLNPTREADKHHPDDD